MDNKPKIEFVEPLQLDEYDATCDIGHEVIVSIFKMLRESGIPPTAIGTVLAVAMGGMAKMGLDPEDFGAMVNHASKMWSFEYDSAHPQLGLQFAPAHRSIKRQEN